MNAKRTCDNCVFCNIKTAFPCIRYPNGRGLPEARICGEHRVEVEFEAERAHWGAFNADCQTWTSEAEEAAECRATALEQRVRNIERVTADVFVEKERDLARVSTERDKLAKHAQRMEDAATGAQIDQSEPGALRGRVDELTEHRRKLAVALAYLVGRVNINHWVEHALAQIGMDVATQGAYHRARLQPHSVAEFDLLLTYLDTGDLPEDAHAAK